jgi:hypothetical protein
MHMIKTRIAKGLGVATDFLPPPLLHIFMRYDSRRFRLQPPPW